MPDLLVEIGTEELPLGAFDVLYADLGTRIKSVLEENMLSFEEVRVEVTPRRIALWAGGIPARQKDRHLEIKGPPVAKAYDDSGHPTQALLGFLRRHEASQDDVQVKALPKGRMVFLEKVQKGQKTFSVMPGLLEEIFSGLSFPKLMRWESSGCKFPRPVRWIAALLDTRLLPFQMGDVKAAKNTFGHRFLAPGSIPLKNADWKDYQRLLEKSHIILSLESRKRKIRKALSERFGQKRYDEELVDITAKLAESPFFIQGDFEKKYLELPHEVLSTCMKKNQKIFACYGARGKLTPHFVAVLDGKRKGLPRICSNYENVLESRLRDARYFYDLDTRKPLEENLAQLDQIIYLGELGTLKDKTGRMEILAEALARYTGYEELGEKLKRAARLSKADLMTQMVFEFPNLQGIAGREYALASGEGREVAEAIGSQYLPRNLSEDYKILRKEISLLGALLGIVDRLDLLTGAFGTGREPSGSQDPFALRRAAGSIVKLVRAFDLHFSLSEMVRLSRDLYERKDLGGRGLAKDTGSLIDAIKGFLKERVIFELRLKPGTRKLEIFEGVWRTGCEDMGDVFERFGVLYRLSQKDPDHFFMAGKVVERTANITKGAGEGEDVRPELFQDNRERKLFKLLQKEAGAITRQLEERKYEDATRLFGRTFYEPVHEFFEHVMVNVPEAGLRLNRQALMRRINRLYTARLADLSVLSKLEKE